VGIFIFKNKVIKMAKIIKMNKRQINIQDIFEKHQELLELTNKLFTEENLEDISIEVEEYYEQLNILYDKLFNLGINVEIYNKK
jgi:hypothetical protein